MPIDFGATWKCLRNFPAARDYLRPVFESKIHFTELISLDCGS